MADNLLPCPFCGTVEGLYPSHRWPGSGAPYAIDCCGCGIDFTPREGMNVIAAWNRRSSDASLGPATINSEMPNSAGSQIRTTQRCGMGVGSDDRTSPVAPPPTDPSHGALIEKRDRLREDNRRLRQIIHQVANALPNGAYISPDCSIEFMEHLPDEVLLVCAALQGDGR